ncbi:hypothetical protein OAE72_01280 [Akkermansiaceae bacterium]|jgi:hypothetical protein|nr:hypothetical protein [Akkermansiaceae bacterium]MDB4384176.1 hypothetical protein [Akkermansiaceae bacterium]MDB4680566.1 hypothetical protein [Akkermansiaceae bacterium]MDF1711504.1 hypothetical protein [Akkermansiaceae bacterium]
MKKLIVLLVVAAIGVGLYFLFEKNEVSQISLMEEAVATLEDYNEGGDASETIEKLEGLALKLSELNKKSGTSSGNADENPEAKAKADRLRGELANASMELEISEKETAQDVAKALDKFIGQ